MPRTSQGQGLTGWELAQGSAEEADFAQTLRLRGKLGSLHHVQPHARLQWRILQEEVRGKKRRPISLPNARSPQTMV
jgi:hypothetical protein